MESTAMASIPPRCRACNQEAKEEDVVMNGFHLPFHKACFPTNHLKSSDATSRAPLAALNSAPISSSSSSSLSIPPPTSTSTAAAASATTTATAASISASSSATTSTTTTTATTTTITTTTTTAAAVAAAAASGDPASDCAASCLPPSHPSTLERRPTSASRESDRHALARLHHFAREPGNDTCADCSAPQPRWISVTLGVFLCPQCSGEHRALGSHISRVRSLGLDHWTAEGIRTVLEWGNVRANAQWEARIPDGFCKPGPLATPSEKRCWVRAKYLHKAFSHGTEFRPEMLRMPLPATAGPVYVGVLRVTVVDAVFSKRMKCACMLRLGRQSVTTKRAPTCATPQWGETHMLSVPSHESALEVTLRRKTRFGSRAYARAAVDLATLPLRQLAADQTHEVKVALKAGCTLTLQLALLCLE